MEREFLYQIDPSTVCQFEMKLVGYEMKVVFRSRGAKEVKVFQYVHPTEVAMFIVSLQPCFIQKWWAESNRMVFYVERE
jgi:hypothetical protein